MCECGRVPDARARWRTCLAGGCRVLLLRHGTTRKEVCDGVAADLTRVLSPRGHAECAAVRRWLARQPLKVVLCSSAPRCRETADGVTSGRFPHDNVVVAVDDTLYGPAPLPPAIQEHFRMHHGCSLDEFVDGAPPAVLAFLDEYVDTVLAATAGRLPMAPLASDDVILVVGHSIYISALAVALARLRGVTTPEAVVGPAAVCGVGGFLLDASRVELFTPASLETAKMGTGFGTHADNQPQTMHVSA